MTTIRVTDADVVVLELEPDEAELLADLAAQVEQLITHEVDDTALTRLFPPAYRDDPVAAAEFERFERAGLAESKVEAARAVHAAAVVGELDRGDTVQIELSASETWAWLTHLTDVRTILADRLGIEDDDSDIEPDDEVLTLLPLYDWLGWLQGALVSAAESLGH
ncbi:MAG: DUF2017 family protein [Leifsonia sp.]